MPIQTPSADDFYRVLPELLWCGFGLLLMLLQPLTKSRAFLATVAGIGAAAGMLSSILAYQHSGPGFFQLIRSDAFSFFFHLLVGLVAVLIILASDSYLEREKLESAEFYALVLFATAGMGVLASANELLTAFIGLEMSSISSYILAGYRRDTLKSSESALKYFLLGSFATAFFLYGIALVYGTTGTTVLDTMGGADTNSFLLKLGLALILIGLGFKVAAAPFQVWTPDVYEGAPTPVTALFAAGPKAGAFALLLRIFATVPAATQYWFWAFWILAALTMFVGNLGALVQTNVKRLLAYSSIAHAGYILVAFAAVTSMTTGDTSPDGAIPAYAAVLFYLLSYALVKVGAFTIVSQLGGKDEKYVTLEDYAGLSERHPWAAAALSLFLLSLLGLPVTAGFFGKFYVFKAAVNANLIWLAVLMAVNSIIGAYYYFKVIVAMYMREPAQDSTAPSAFPITVNIVLAVSALGTLYFGLFPNQALRLLLEKALIGGLK